MPISKNNTPQNLNLFSHHITFFSQGLQVLCTHMNITKKKKGGLRIETYHFFIDQIISYLYKPSKPTHPNQLKLKLWKKGASVFFF